MFERTFLRIRRRRNAQTSSTLRFDATCSRDAAALAMQQLQLEDLEQEQPLSKRRKSAFWKRVQSTDRYEDLSEEILLNEDEKEVDENKRSDRRENFKRQRSIRIVDARLDDDEQEEDQSQQQRQAKKRRRLSLLNVEQTTLLSACIQQQRKKSSTSFRVLTPLERMVDDSLAQVHAGEVRAAQHIRLIQTDPNLYSHQRHWLCWCNNSSGGGGGGNILHACAAWDEVDVARMLLLMAVPGGSLATTLGSQTDSEGRTPYELAEVLGHSRMTCLLEAFGADTSNYVYDIYCLEDDEAENGDNDSSGAESCELREGNIYFDDEGKLILEPPASRNRKQTEEEEDDDDSNDEDWEGNDYPDDEDDDASSADMDDVRAYERFRSYDISHDASYGIYGQGEAEYDSEC